MLEVKTLNQFYGGSHTLWDVDLAVPPGSRMCLMGRNGMGKTTLLRCIMGLQPSRSGAILFDGKDLTQCRAEERAKLGIGYVPQGREIFPYLTVEENLRIGIGVRKNGAKTIPTRIFDLFPVLKKMLSRRGGDLFGRPTAATCHRSRAGPRTQTVDPGRAHRRDSTKCRPRNRRHHFEVE